MWAVVFGLGGIVLIPFNMAVVGQYFIILGFLSLMSLTFGLGGMVAMAGGVET
jgi:hypothetical protein